MRTVQSLVFIALTGLLLPGNAEAQRLKPSSKIVAQPDAPITIKAYNGFYRERTQYNSEGILHEVQYENKGAGQVVAVQFGFVSFDVWNEFLDRLNGLTTEPLLAGKTETGRWSSTSYRGFSFLTGVAFVSKVRFADGTIWRADEEVILRELRQIEKDFDASRLKAETPPKQ
ncbi:MAG TPA: hypothetical protein VNT81_11925 [Vicinamibacterales bacterium]|nr:hypothetical protein [Vicinamibacterales bacterium]